MPIRSFTDDEASAEPQGEQPTFVPPDQLAPDTLRRLCEEFVTRDGTDYGRVEKTLDEKVESLMRALDAGEAAIVYESESETINIVSIDRAG